MPLVVLDARDAFVQPLRGWGRYARELMDALQADPGGLDLHVVRQGGALPELAFEQVSLPRLLRRLRANLVHAPNCFLPLRRPCPGVVTIHDLAFEALPEDFSRITGAKFRTITPRAARSAERVICVSRFTAEDVVARYRVAEDRIRVVPNAPALPIGDGPVPDGTPYLLAVGDLRGKKNLDRLIAAWGRAGTGRRLVLAGAGDIGTVPPGVEVTGYVDDAALDGLMRGADLLVHPSLYEGFGLVVLEAMARGTPVACSDTTALPETAGGAAELFDPLDQEDIARAITSALADAQRLGAAGRARAAEFSWARSAAATRAVYEELL